MTSCHTVCALVLLMLFSGPALGQTFAPRTTNQPRMPSGNLEFRLHQDYLIVVEGNLGDLRTQNLLIDTGTDPTVLDKRVARKLHLKLEHARIGMISHDVDAWRTVLPTCEVGPITCRNFNVLVEDLSFLERGLGTRIDAVIGLDVLSSLSFTIDYRKGRILFGLPEALDYKVGFESDPPLVLVMMTLNGKSTRLLVDTGASSLMLFKTRWSQNRGRPREAFFLHPKEVTRQSLNLAGELARQMTATITSLGGVGLGRQTAFLVDDRGTTGNFDGVFNPAAMGLKAVSFDFEHRSLGWSR